MCRRAKQQLLGNAAISLQDLSLTVLLDGAAGVKQAAKSASSTAAALTFRLRGLDVATSSAAAEGESEQFRASVALKGFSIDMQPACDRQSLHSPPSAATLCPLSPSPVRRRSAFSCLDMKRVQHTDALKFNALQCRPSARSRHAQPAQTLAPSSVVRRWGMRAELTWRPSGRQGRAAATMRARVFAHALAFDFNPAALRAVLAMRAGVAAYQAHARYRRTRPQVLA